MSETSVSLAKSEISERRPGARCHRGRLQAQDLDATPLMPETKAAIEYGEEIYIREPNCPLRV